MWTAWMPIQAYGYSGAKPYAVLGPNVTRYGTDWQRPEWRFDPSTGMVEYQGLCSLGLDKAGAFELVINYMDPTPKIPRLAAGSAVARMVTGMTNMGDLSWGHPTRYDVVTNQTSWPGSHHHIYWSMGTVAPVAGRWFWLNQLLSFADNGDPDWYPWRPVINTATLDGWSVAMASRFSTSYSSTWDATVRCTKDYKHWQWRGIVRNSGGAYSGSPYNNVAVVTHPNPQTYGNCLNTVLTEGAWQGGSAQPVRLDVRQHASGHQLDLVGAVTTYNPSWTQLHLDYFTRP